MSGLYISLLYYLKSKEEKILNQSRYELSDERVMLYFIENNFPNKNKMINNLIKEMLSDNLDITDEEKLSLFKYFKYFLGSIPESTAKFMEGSIVDW